MSLIKRVVQDLFVQTKIQSHLLTVDIRLPIPQGGGGSKAEDIFGDRNFQKKA